MSQPLLFTPWSLRGVVFRNRIGVSPMCQYSSTDGLANEWHQVHLGSRAVGGAGLVMTEAAAVSPEGRISPADLGLWNDAQCDVLAPIVRFVESHGAVAGVQLAHAGRKASVDAPFRGGAPLAPEHGGWSPLLAPSAVAFSPKHQTPAEMTSGDIARVTRDFRDAALRALDAGFRVLELHGAHGYLLHEFLSPLSNERTDAFGGSFDARIRFVLGIVESVRAVWPERLPLLMRLSVTDWTEGGWDVEQSVELARRLAPLGVDAIDCSSGGNVGRVAIPVAPGYQVPFAARIRREGGLPTIAVGLITDAAQAEQILQDGSADMVLLARELLRDPHWPLRAARELGAEVAWPPQYERARLPSI